jgi:hypothetical protein
MTKRRAGGCPPLFFAPAHHACESPAPVALQPPLAPFITLALVSVALAELAHRYLKLAGALTLHHLASPSVFVNTRPPRSVSVCAHVSARCLCSFSNCRREHARLHSMRLFGPADSRLHDAQPRPAFRKKTYSASYPPL